MRAKSVLAEVEAVAGSAAVAGRIVGVDSSGRALVVVGSQFESPLIARSLIQLDQAAVSDLSALPAVAVIFENGDPSLPIIAGWLHERIVSSGSKAIPAQSIDETAVLEAKRIVLRADVEFELLCGASSILLRRDGHVVIKGAQLVSRASGSNKIKGATVDIN
jgi:hypothetical protein